MSSYLNLALTINTTYLRRMHLANRIDDLKHKKMPLLYEVITCNIHSEFNIHSKFNINVSFISIHVNFRYSNWNIFIQDRIWLCSLVTFYSNSNIFTLFGKFLFEFKYFCALKQDFIQIKIYLWCLTPCSSSNIFIQTQIFLCSLTILFEFRYIIIRIRIFKYFNLISYIILHFSNFLFEFKYFYAH